MLRFSSRFIVFALSVVLAFGAVSEAAAVTKPQNIKANVLKKLVPPKAEASTIAPKKVVPKKVAPRKVTPVKPASKAAPPKAAVKKVTSPKAASAVKSVPKGAAPTKLVAPKKASAPVKTVKKVQPIVPADGLEKSKVEAPKYPIEPQEDKWADELPAGYY